MASQQGQKHLGNLCQADNHSGGEFSLVSSFFHAKAIMRACTHVRLSTHTLPHTHRVLTPVASFARAASNDSPTSVPATAQDGVDLSDLQSEDEFVLRQTSSKIFEIMQKKNVDSYVDRAGGLPGASANLLVVDDDPPLGEENGAEEVGSETKGKVAAFQAEKPEVEQVLAGSAPARRESEDATGFSRQTLMMEQVVDEKLSAVLLTCYQAPSSCCSTHTFPALLLEIMI